MVAFAPSLREPDNLAATYPDVLNRMFGGDPQRFWAQHPLHLARENADRLRTELPIAFYCGTADSLLPGVYGRGELTHHWWAVPTVDVALAAVLVAGWHGLLRGPHASTRAWRPTPRR